MRRTPLHEGDQVGGMFARSPDSDGARNAATSPKLLDGTRNRALGGLKSGNDRVWASTEVTIVDSGVIECAI
jgi:hypothetical protein